MYFSAFPKIYYDFAQDNTSTSLQILTDITTNVRVRKEVLENITLYDEYDMMDGETPEIVAEKVYGNPELHWVIMLVNQKYNYIQDFPLTNGELYEHCVATYGEDYLEDVHHYEREGIQTNAVAELIVPRSIALNAKVNDIITVIPKTSSKVTSIDLDTSTLTLNVAFGRFVNGQKAILSGLRYANVDGVEKKGYGTISDFNVLANSFTVNSNYNLVTNYEYELNENEKKRRIKLISPTLINQFITEYMSLVTPT
jgi:hypothetical protein